MAAIVNKVSLCLLSRGTRTWDWNPKNSIYTTQTMIGCFWYVKFRAQVINQWETRREYKNFCRDALS